MIDELDRTLTALNAARLQAAEIEASLPTTLTSERLSAGRELFRLRAEIERHAMRLRHTAPRASCPPVRPPADHPTTPDHLGVGSDSER